MELHNHRVNTSEGAIQTWNNHFISGSCTTDSNFPTQLWDQLIPQSQDTLNIMQTSCIDPTKLAYEVLYSEYKFDKLLVALLDIKTIIHEPAESRASCAPRGTDTCYLTPSKEHYYAA